jgi:hypothetical protein
LSGQSGTSLLSIYMQMKTRKVSSYKELEAAIAELKESKAKHEELLKQNLGEVKEALKPVNIIKSSLKTIIADKALHHDALMAGLSISAEYLVEKLFKSNKSPKRHFAATIFEKLLTGFVK